METTNKPQQTLAFINDKSPIVDVICNELANSGVEILFRSENIESGSSQLSVLTVLPDVCIIDLEYYDKNILSL